MASAKILESKKAKVEQITELLKNATAGVIVDYKGITVEEDTKLRKELREAGVKIFEYKPGFVHAKTYLVDDKVAMVGTINMDYRSLYLHFECGTLFYGSHLIPQLKEDALHVFEVSRQVKRNESRRSNLFKDVGNAILRVLAPLL